MINQLTPDGVLFTGIAASNAPLPELKEVPYLLPQIQTCSPEASPGGRGTPSVIPAPQLSPANPSPVKEKVSRRGGRPSPPSQENDTGLSTQAPLEPIASPAEVKLPAAASLVLKKAKGFPCHMRQVRSCIFCDPSPP